MSAVREQRDARKRQHQRNAQPALPQGNHTPLSNRVPQVPQGEPPSTVPPSPAARPMLDPETPAAAERDTTSPAAPAPAVPSVGRGSFLRGFVYAWNGLVYAIRTQRNARVHAAIGSAAILLGILLRISTVEFAMVFVAITLVFIAEMFNTVTEAVVDLITNEYHPLARIAKDVAAGAVLLNAMLSVVIGALVFLPHLVPLVLRWLGH